MRQDSVFISLLKKHTDIDKSFINTFFKKFKIGGELDFNIRDTHVIKYLGIQMKTLRSRLLNKFSNSKMYIETIDYIKIKSGNTTGLTYMLNYQCFERLAMNGDSEKSESVRLYFSKLREFITENHKLIYQAIENKNDLNIYSGYESIYFIAIDERNSKMLKLGRTKDIVQRLRNYNVGRIKEVDLKYFALVRNPLLIENCIKSELNHKKVFENREIFNISTSKLKKMVDYCYCKYVSSKKNDNLYKEISDLLGLYAYTKDKIHIKPYVIIGKNI